MTKRYECSRRHCRWTGTDDEKNRTTEKMDKLEITTLVCPKCGCDSFYELPDPAPSERADKANEWLRFIGDHGRRFFFHDGHYATLEQDARGRVWFVDYYSRRRIYTHTERKWRGFTSGGTLRGVVEVLRDYIRLGHQFNPGYFTHTRLSGGHIWGYSTEDMTAIRDEGVRLGIVTKPQEAAA
ncbi:hypothetical protein PU634_04900 [Oceanimonas pelagia]|uniref:Uncharacterized protein n=1 Tax=Oceanimonas pelagia TaxID=3028314 RepID=A0AA50KRF3_9GAMM|nr:hypothetical protein [Oceanimonas pelagia]WMC11705.1 hypothetical protein PU634_04900 [Oceanimonas pelagia]